MELVLQHLKEESLDVGDFLNQLFLLNHLRYHKTESSRPLPSVSSSHNSQRFQRLQSSYPHLQVERSHFERKKSEKSANKLRVGLI